MRVRVSGMPATMRTPCVVTRGAQTHYFAAGYMRARMRIADSHAEVLAVQAQRVEHCRRALEAAGERLKFDNKNVKALYRRAQASEAVQDYTAAIVDLELLTKLHGVGLSGKQIQIDLNRVLRKEDALVWSGGW